MGQFERMENTSHAIRRRRPSQRRDGASSRAAILDAAGRVFARKGFAEATLREICALAKVNSAAVNYHFGGKEELYDEVLVEAHRQILRLEVISGIVASDLPPQEKLGALFGVIGKAAACAEDLWGVGVLARELTFPSPMLPEALVAEIQPKAALVRALVASLAGVPGDSPVAAQALQMVIAPCLTLLLFSAKMRSVLPGAVRPDEADFRQNMLAYALGGLQALKERHAGLCPGQTGGPEKHAG